ncbi:hypothetical protein Clacol_000513 [Clathrus columnatus]|uniref:DUF1168-domain-containing protein n=1 Tax=Clathrus columnatus TaxID=1419009 RepID=A0AAV4ZYM0_9AGAM|nr:hypothetical protein Clacol_000513 [Clathrus columnatus]
MSSSTLSTTPTTTTSNHPLGITGDIQPANRHALTAVEKQRAQLAKLLKDPAKPVFIPPPPKEKTVRPPREMMKNVQGSSAGAGSGEFHVYKANRRREYERLKLMDDQKAKEQEIAEFEQKKREREESVEAKTAKNRAKRMKKKERAKSKGKEAEQRSPEMSVITGDTSNAPFKKRRLVNGSEIKFQFPGETYDSGEEGDGKTASGDDKEGIPSDNEGPPRPSETMNTPLIPIVEQKIVIYDSD